MEYIYHVPENNKDLDNSPFYSKLIKMLPCENLRIASPYIDANLISSLFNSIGNLTILTDINECYKSCNRKNRDELNQFFKENIGGLYHQEKLHAKVFLSESQVILGSSNLTKPGLFTNNEFAILLSAPENDLTEIRNWFDSWCKLSTRPNQNELDKLAEYLNSQKEEYSEMEIQESYKIKSTAPKIKYSFPLKISKRGDYSNQTNAVFRDLGNEYKDKKKIYEIHLDDELAEIMPTKQNQRIPILLSIDSETYEVGLRYTERSGAWISPDAIKNGEKIRLTDIRENHQIERNERVYCVFDNSKNILKIEKMR